MSPGKYSSSSDFLVRVVERIYTGRRFLVLSFYLDVGWERSAVARGLNNNNTCYRGQNVMCGAEFIIYDDQKFRNQISQTGSISTLLNMCLNPNSIVKEKRTAKLWNVQFNELPKYRASKNPALNEINKCVLNETLSSNTLKATCPEVLLQQICLGFS